MCHKVTQEFNSQQPTIPKENKKINLLFFS